MCGVEQYGAAALEPLYDQHLDRTGLEHPRFVRYASLRYAPVFPFHAIEPVAPLVVLDEHLLIRRISDPITATCTSAHGDATWHITGCWSSRPVGSLCGTSLRLLTKSIRLLRNGGELSVVGRRKFYLTMCALLMTGGLCVGGFIDQNTYATVVIGVISFFTGGNIGEHLARRGQPASATSKEEQP